MALLQDLIKQIDDETLRQRIMAEVSKLSKQKKFGLVFEEHLPECTPLYDVEIRRNSKVALKTGQVSDIYIVRSIDGDKALNTRQIMQRRSLPWMILLPLRNLESPSIRISSPSTWSAMRRTVTCGTH